MGTFSVALKMRNMFDEYLPEDERGEVVECEAVVDTGAMELVLPADLVERLGLKPLGTIQARTADGECDTYRVCGIVELEVQGRTCHVRAIELPRGSEALLGAIPLEEMDWHVAPQERRLVPNPRSPEGPLLPLLAVRAS